MKDVTVGRPATMECVVIGGCADGLYLRELRSDAQVITLARPKAIKPFKTSTQQQPDVEKETDTYEVHLFDMSASARGEQPVRRITGVAVIQGKSMAWAFKQLVLSYLEKAIRQLQEEKPKRKIQTH